MIKLKAIKPGRDPFDTAAYRRALKQGLDTTARHVKEQFERTTATWQHSVSFSIDSPSDHERIIGTDDDVYGYVDDGTRPHVIVAHGRVLTFGPGSQAKTRPRVVGSGSGGGGGATIFRPRVSHPGTEPREFSETIGEEAEQRLADDLQQAIDGVG